MSKHEAKKRHMPKLMRLIYSNKFFAILMLIFQLFLIFAGIWLVTGSYYRYAYIVMQVLAVFVILIEVNRTEEPDFKITWVLLVAAFPVFGFMLYIFLHYKVMQKGMNDAYTAATDAVRPYISTDTGLLGEIAEYDADDAGIATYLDEYGGGGVYKNTQIKYYALGEDMFADIAEDLKNAKCFIYLEFFIINLSGKLWSEIFGILKQKAREGVDIRLMFDGMGCLTTLPRGYDEKIRSYGIKCHVFSPVQPLLSTYQNNRDHRKIIVVDGKCAYTGGVNLADEYANYIRRFGHWKDGGIRMNGDAVKGMTALFMQIWNMGEDEDDIEPETVMNVSDAFPCKAEGYVIPYSDTPLDRVNVGKQVYLYNIQHATKYCHITTPYLVIGNDMFEALRFAVHRGVDVAILMPHIPDKLSPFWLARTYYPELIAGGVKIYEYTPGFVHEKMCICDDERAIVGTINFDYRSLYLHYENAVFMSGVPQIAGMEKDFEETVAKSRQITQEDYKNFPFYTRAIGRITRLVAPLI